MKKPDPQYLVQLVKEILTRKFLTRVRDWPEGREFNVHLGPQEWAGMSGWGPREIRRIFATPIRTKLATMGPEKLGMIVAFGLESDQVCRQTGRKTPTTAALEVNGGPNALTALAVHVVAAAITDYLSVIRLSQYRDIEESAARRAYLEK